MNQVINFNEPYKTNRIKKYVNLALESNYYSSGEFEHRCKEFLENKYGFKNTGTKIVVEPLRINKNVLEYLSS